ncbi:MAG: sialidase family protein [Vicinamibacterales bacterium]
MVSVVDRANLMQGRCAALASFDGGRTWSAHMFAFPRCYDPWVAILEDGTAVFAGLETNDLGQVPHLWLFRSPDGGRTWPDLGHSFGRGHDHPTLIVDRSQGKFHGLLYLTSTHVVRDAQSRVRNKVFVARSSDGARTFSQIVDHEVSNMNNVIMTAAVLPDGALLVPLTAIQRRVADD